MGVVQFKTQSRNGLLAKIHIAKKQLALEEESYRNILKNITGKTSCSHMSDAELEAVLKGFKNLGFKVKKQPPKRAGSKPMADTPQASKIRALWLNLYHIGAIKDPSEEKLAAFSKRMCRVESMQWLTSKDADKVIKALRGWLHRVGMIFPDADSVKALASRRSYHYPEEISYNSNVCYRSLAEKIYVILYQARLIGITRDEIIDLIVDLDFDAPSHLSLINYADVDPLIEKLGAIVRRNKK